MIWRAGAFLTMILSLSSGEMIIAGPGLELLRLMETTSKVRRVASGVWARVARADRLTVSRTRVV